MCDCVQFLAVSKRKLSPLCSACEAQYTVYNIQYLYQTAAAEDTHGVACLKCSFEAFLEFSWKEKCVAL